MTWMDGWMNGWLVGGVGPRMKLPTTRANCVEIGSAVTRLHLLVVVDIPPYDRGEPAVRATSHTSQEP